MNVANTDLCLTVYSLLKAFRYHVVILEGGQNPPDACVKICGSVWTGSTPNHAVNLVGYTGILISVISSLLNLPGYGPFGAMPKKHHDIKQYKLVLPPHTHREFNLRSVALHSICFAGNVIFESIL